MELTEYKIKLPTLPLGLEFAGPGESQEGDFAPQFCDGKWCWQQVPAGGDFDVLARPREPLAGWANNQRLFQALAEIFKARLNARLSYDSDARWIFDADFMQRQSVALETPPTNLTGKLRLEAGKWVDAT